MGDVSLIPLKTEESSSCQFSVSWDFHPFYFLSLLFVYLDAKVCIMKLDSNHVMETLNCISYITLRMGPHTF